MDNYLRTERFESVSVILPVINETTSLKETVDIVLRDARPKIKEFIIVICQKTTSEAMSAIEELQGRLGDLIHVYQQKLPFLGGAMRDAFAVCRGSHTLMMASDLETDPTDVKRLIEEAETNPAAIVTASRWRAGGSFRGYSKVKLVANWLFQHFFSLLYATKLSDMTFGFRIFPTRLLHNIEWEELKHPFLFESLIKPLRLGVPVMEIGSAWQARLEGESQNTFLRNFVYFRIGLKTRFSRRASFLHYPEPPCS